MFVTIIVKCSTNFFTQLYKNVRRTQRRSVSYQSQRKGRAVSRNPRLDDALKTKALSSKWGCLSPLLHVPHSLQHLQPHLPTTPTFRGPTANMLIPEQNLEPSKDAEPMPVIPLTRSRQINCLKYGLQLRRMRSWEPNILVGFLMLKKFKSITKEITIYGIKLEWDFLFFEHIIWIINHKISKFSFLPFDKICFVFYF